MGRQNNVSRSLQIISRAQGWDPNKISGEQAERPDGDLTDIFPIRETPFTNVTGPVPEHAVHEVPYDHPGGPNHTFNTPDTSREKPNHTVNADPAPGIPGAR